MKQDEILQLLERQSIIVQIGDDWLLTEKYKGMVAELNVIEQAAIIPDAVKKEVFADKFTKIMDPKEPGKDWPEAIGGAKGRPRALAVMDVCEIPPQSPNGQYMLRGLTNETIDILGKMIESEEFNPPDFIMCIKDYYRNSEMPMGFKKLICEGSIIDLYNNHMKGGTTGSAPNKENGTWS